MVRGKGLFRATALGVGMLLAWLLLLVVAPAGAQTPPSGPAERAAAAANWLIAVHQNDDGGYSAFSAGANVAPSDVAGTVDTLLALAPAGADLAAPLNYLQNNPDAVAAYAAQDGGTAGKLLMALTAAGQNPRDFLGYNLVISLTAHLSLTGQFGVNNAFNQSLAMLGLDAAGDAVPAGAVDWLLAQQAPAGDVAGSWDDGFGTAGNPDATAMAIMALVAAGRPAGDPALIAARDFLAAAQQDGGWEYGPGFGPNANSTALVILALQALGEDFAGAESAWARNGQSPQAILFGWQSDSGAFQADFGDGPFDDFFTTVQALPAAATQAGHAPAGAMAEGGVNPPGWVAWLLIGLAAVVVLSLVALAGRNGVAR